MNEQFDKLIYASGLIADGCWDKFDQYDKDALHKFAELIVWECVNICLEMSAKCAGLPGDGALAKDCAHWIKKDFGIEQ